MTDLREDPDLLVALLPVAPALLHHGHDDVLGGHEGQLGLDPPLDDLGGTEEDSHELMTLDDVLVN